MHHPIDLPETITGAALADLVYEIDTIADESRRTPPNGEEIERRQEDYDSIPARAAKWRLVRSRDAGQKGDVPVTRGGRVSWYRPMRKVEENEAPAIPHEAIRRGFSAGMQRALWGCVA